MKITRIEYDADIEDLTVYFNDVPYPFSHREFEEDSLTRKYLDDLRNAIRQDIFDANGMLALG